MGIETLESAMLFFIELLPRFVFLGILFIVLNKYYKALSQQQVSVFIA